MNSRRNAFGICVTLGIMAGAAPTLWDVGAAPGSVLAIMSEGTRAAWAIMLVGGSLLALLGISLRDATLGVILEASGMALMAVPAALYAVVALGENGWPNAALAAGAFVGLALGGVARMTQCVVTLYQAYRLGQALDHLRGRDGEDDAP